MTKVDEYNKQFADLQTFMNALDWARKQDLDLEWLDSFLGDYLSTNDIIQSIAHANREWDL